MKEITQEEFRVIEWVDNFGELTRGIYKVVFVNSTPYWRAIKPFTMKWNPVDSEESNEQMLKKLDEIKEALHKPVLKLKDFINGSNKND